MAAMNEPLRQLLVAAYGFLRPRNERAYKQHASAFSFHMVDWWEDAEAFGRVVAHPERYTPLEAARAASMFLVHAPSHINMAARLADCLYDNYADDARELATMRREAERARKARKVRKRMPKARTQAGRRGRARGGRSGRGDTQ